MRMCFASFVSRSENFLKRICETPRRLNLTYLSRLLPDSSLAMRMKFSCLRSLPRFLGHRLHLVRLPAGSDPSLPHLPDRTGLTREVRLCGDHAGDSGEDLWKECGEGLRVSAAEVKKYTSGDSVAKERTAYLQDARPHFETYGPKTRRAFLEYLRVRAD